MTARRRARLALAALATVSTVTLGAVSACSGDRARPPGPPADETTVNWYVGSTDQNQKDYARIVADEFQVANPPITVKITYAPKNTDSARAVVIDALRPGAPNPPDIYLGDVIWPAEFASQGRALPLDDQFDQAFWSRFEPELVRSVTYQGRIYAAPFFADQGMLFYRKDLVPTPPRTWEALARDARDLVRRGRVQYGYAWQGAEYEGLTCVWTEVLADAGGRTLTADGTRSAINSPEALKALQFLRGLVTDGTSPPGVTGFEESEASQLFATGRAAFLRGWNTAYSRLAAPNNPDNPLRGKVAVAPLPTFAGRPGRGHSTVGGWSLYINPDTHRLAAAKTFIRWMTAFQAQLQLARFSQIPTIAEVRRAAVARTNPALATGLAVDAVARPASTPKYPAVSKAIYTNLHAALDGTLSPQAALSAADQDINRSLN
jgi:multiple sugar transport system substrate-binding protein